jgi:hypothetical protein
MSLKRKIRLLMLVVLLSLLKVSNTFSAPNPRWVVREGERIIFPDKSRMVNIANVMSIHFPVNSVEEATLVQYHLSYWRFADDPEMMILFQPEGLQFLNPVVLNIKLKHLDYDVGDVIFLFHYNVSVNDWDYVDEFLITQPDTECNLYIDGFSLYAFTRIRGPVD